ncbi:alpha-ketoacid dehydrogenase subunit beta [Conexibacter woesei]|uniref:Transketolase central region n=1 Tax=Conexibacter woesei (strain DSM 14684 / CCUG 47730 / CIP 108061 / JCM 11494 / NBRC 100937 / ID131577) TaxID=469383 RepID=D3FD88_CONWI|nr:pyruvate dehydrogenase complex E1 component subunit beta [Conexibacter woesei]ADB53480.1 Transketolase central region [Conexibacter woesei DSM 14684]
MSQVTYKEAIRRAQEDALAENDRVVLLGEDIAAAGGAFKVTDRLFERFGPERVLDTPISEQAIVGAAIGAALKGRRPVAELMFADFAAVCFDQIANQLAKYRYMTGGQVTLPVTLRLSNGAGGGFASQHSQTVENWFLNCPGLKVVVPGSPADAYGLFMAAVRDEDPVLFFEHKGMYNVKGELGPAGEAIEIGRAGVIRSGTSATVVATQLMRQRAERVAEELAAEGIELELIDPRTVLPLDLDTIGASVDKTGRLVVVQESPLGGSWGATVVAGVVAERFESLDAAPVLVSGPDTPVPYAGPLEDAWLPSERHIAGEIRSLLGA